MTSTTQLKIDIPGNHLMTPLLGAHDEHLRLIEAAFPGTRVVVRGNEVSIDGEPATLVRTIDMVQADESPSEVLTSEVLRSGRGRTVKPKTAGQKRYVDAIRSNTVTFGLG